MPTIAKLSNLDQASVFCAGPGPYVETSGLSVGTRRVYTCTYVGCGIFAQGNQTCFLVGLFPVDCFPVIGPGHAGGFFLCSHSVILLGVGTRVHLHGKNRFLRIYSGEVLNVV